jgi:hypothetical protein
MGIINSIALEGIREPSDLATALRLLLEDRLDDNMFDIENPEPRYEGDKRRNYRFCGVETAFVFGPESGGPRLRVDVADVDLIADSTAYGEIMGLIRRLGPAKALARLQTPLGASADPESHDPGDDADDDQVEPAEPALTLGESALLDAIRAMGEKEASRRLLLLDDPAEKEDPAGETPSAVVQINRASLVSTSIN